MEVMTGFDRAIVVDAAVTGGCPGSVRRLDPAEVPTQRTAIAHGIDLPRALELGRLQNALTRAQAGKGEQLVKQSEPQPLGQQQGQHQQNRDIKRVHRAGRVGGITRKAGP